MEIQLALIKTEPTMPKLKKIALTELPALDELDLEKGQPDNALVQDIVNRGQLNPILVIKVGVNKYSIVDGNKRLASFIKLNEIDENGGYDKILAMVVNESEEAAMTAAVASNQMRKGNAITDLKGIRYLQEKYPAMGDKAMAMSLGMNLGTFKRRKKLIVLSDVILDAIYEGKVSVPVAEFIADRPYLQAGAIAKLAEKKVVSMDSLKDLERNRKSDLVANNADQLGLDMPVPAIPDDFPATQPNARDIAIVEELGLVLYGVIVLVNKIILTPILDEQDQMVKDLVAANPDAQVLYVFGR